LFTVCVGCVDIYLSLYLARVFYDLFGIEAFHLKNAYIQCIGE
jgi:hypothetical protein